VKLQESHRKTPEVPIIALIDILAILLIFFIVTTTFKKSRPVLEIDLPTVKELPSQSVSDTRAVLAVSKEGEITLDGTVVEAEALAAALQSFKEQNPEGKLELEADETVNLSQLFFIWDALTKADIEIKDVPARIKLPAK